MIGKHARRRWRNRFLLATATAAAAVAVSAGAASAAGPPPAPAGSVVRVATGAPGGATVLGHVTAVAPTGNGWATVFTCGEAIPPTVSVIYNSGVTTAGYAAVRADSQGAICIHTSQRTQLLFDVEAATTTVPSGRAVRKLDTRSGPRPAAGSVTRIKTSAAPGSIAAGTLTATLAERPGWLAAYACDAPRPVMSSVNYGTSGRASNFVAVRADSQGDICVFTTSPTHILFDESFTSRELAADPARTLDTRVGGVAVTAGSVVRVPTGKASSTVWGALTAVPTPGQSGWLAAYPCDGPRPLASAVSFPAGSNTAGYVAVRTDARGEFCVYTSGTAHVLFDRQAASAAASPAPPVRKLDSRADWSGASQLLTVTVDSKTSTRAKIAFWERGADGKFRTVRSTSQGWVGELGIGQGQWGVPRTPEGAYNMTEAFGILSNPGTKMPYFKVDSLDWWDGDPNSPTYNTHVRKTWVPGAGSERLINFGYAYYYAAAFDYNPERNPARGSAFFFHVSTNEPTGGCISAPIGDVSAILRAMDPSKSPVIMVGQGPWGTALADRTWRP